MGNINSPDKNFHVMVLFEQASGGQALRCSFAIATTDQKGSPNELTGQKPYVFTKSGYATIKKSNGEDGFYPAALLLTAFVLSQLEKSKTGDRPSTSLYLDILDTYTHGAGGFLEQDTLDPTGSHRFPDLDPFEVMGSTNKQERRLDKVVSVLGMDAHASLELRRNGLIPNSGSPRGDIRDDTRHAARVLSQVLESFQRMSGKTFSNVLDTYAVNREDITDDKDVFEQARLVKRELGPKVLEAEEAFLEISSDIPEKARSIVVEATRTGKDISEKDKKFLETMNAAHLRTIWAYLQAQRSFNAAVLERAFTDNKRTVRKMNMDDPHLFAMLLKRCAGETGSNPTNTAQQWVDSRLKATLDF